MSRRDQIIMTEEEIASYLKSSKTMMLVSNGNDGYPHPMPMWFYADDEGVVFMTTFRKSQKVLNLKRDNKVSLLVESGEQYQELKSVLIYSDVEIIDDLDTTLNTLYQVALQRGDVTSDQQNAALEGMRKSAEKRVTLKFTPKNIVTWDHSKLGGVY